MIEREKLLKTIENNLESYLDFLKKLVNVNSFTRNPEGIKEVNSITANKFAELGFSAREVDSTVPGFGPHQILEKKGSSEYWIGMISHSDTVYPPEEEKKNNFHWLEEGEKIYGPGTIDIKGGTAMIFALLHTLSQLTPKLFEKINWKILIDASEEDDNRDFGKLVSRELPPKQTLGALVFEPGKYEEKNRFWLVTARKGMAVFKIRAEGRSAHSGTNHKKGANAVVQLAEVTTKLALLTDYSREITVNPGPFRGGTVTNRVPDWAELELELRAFDDKAFREIKEKILSFDGYSSVFSESDRYPCRVKVEVLRQTRPWPPNPRTEQLFAYWKKAAEELGFQVYPESRGGLSDANLIWDQYPVIDGLGPAGANAHCSEKSPDGKKEPEYLNKNSFIPKLALNFKAITLLLSERD